MRPWFFSYSHKHNSMWHNLKQRSEFDFEEAKRLLNKEGHVP